jgi:predicted ATPase/DNA-binding CsgD family transcriptional regulator
VGADEAGVSPDVHGFSPALTSFVGRAEAVRDVAGLLDTGRLVTVLGPGGVGKTRLAGEVARRVAARYADGVWLAELAAVTDPGRVPAAVAAALGVPDRPGIPVAGTLATALARLQVLIVLDNCEQVITAVAELCGALLPASDDVQVLATSREPVGLAGENRYRLAPLAVPEPGQETGGSEAMALFSDRARQADPRFRLDSESGPLVARLVRQLDGLPLALELAAARIESLGVPQLLERLDERLSLLIGADRLAAARHRSLAATVDWSYQLLSGAEQRVFRQISVFPGPFTLEGAEAVAGPAAGPAVLHLVDCSLLTPPSAGADGRSRYLMLDTLRAYGAGRLDEADEQPAARAALARYAVGIAEQAAAAMRTSAGESPAVRWLDSEDATIRLALDWALGHAPEIAVRLVAALGLWWYIRGQLAAVLPLLRAAAKHAGPPGDLWCAVQYWIGHAGHISGEFTLARDSFSPVIEAAADRAPWPLLADALASRAAALGNMNQIRAGLDDARRAVAVARDLDYPASEALALGNLSLIAYYAGDLETALAQVRQAARIDPAVIPGWIARRASVFLSMFLIETGDWPAAEESCQDGLSRAREANDLRSETVFLAHMADLDLHAGRIADAGRHLRESLELSIRMGDPIGLLNDLDRAALLCAATRRWPEAVALWGAFAGQSRDHDLADVPQDVRRREEPSRLAREALGAAATRAAEQRGAAMTLATAAELAALVTVTEPPSPAGQLNPVTAAAGQLSPRERELVALVARGRTDAQIAAELFISVRTVRSHLDRIRDKTGCRRRAELTRLALEQGLV